MKFQRVLPFLSLALVAAILLPSCELPAEDEGYSVPSVTVEAVGSDSLGSLSETTTEVTGKDGFMSMLEVMASSLYASSDDDYLYDDTTWNIRPLMNILNSVEETEEEIIYETPTWFDEYFTESVVYNESGMMISMSLNGDFEDLDVLEEAGDGMVTGSALVSVSVDMDFNLDENMEEVYTAMQEGTDIPDMFMDVDGSLRSSLDVELDQVSSPESMNAQGLVSAGVNFEGDMRMVSSIETGATSVFVGYALDARKNAALSLEVYDSETETWVGANFIVNLRYTDSFTGTFADTLELSEALAARADARLVLDITLYDNEGVAGETFTITVDDVMPEMDAPVQYMNRMFQQNL